MTTGIDELLYILDHAFSGEDWHSLLSNLRDLSPEEWQWTPPRGQRSISDIVQHVGSCKLMYENYAFGDAALDWDDQHVTGESAIGDASTAIPWLRNVHEHLRRSIAGLDDAELDRLRMTNWGELRETRWIISIMIQHDLYHAGEINHLRSIYRGDDRWEHEHESESGLDYRDR